VTGQWHCLLVALVYADRKSSLSPGRIWTSEQMEVNVLSSCVHDRFGNTKTESSGRLSLLIQSSLTPSWIGGRSRFTLRKRIFFSLDSAQRQQTLIRPVCRRGVFGLLLQANIEGKQIGWHSFRHFVCDGFASTRCRYQSSPGVIATGEQRTTLDIYTGAVSQQKRDANKKFVEMMLPRGMKKFQHPSAPSMEREAARYSPATAWY
jgi:hypothetical protein